MRIRATWVFTVGSETKACAATSALDRPRATSRRISASRGVSVSTAGGGWGGVSGGRGLARRLGRPGHVLLDQLPGDRRREQRVTARDHPDRLDELLGCDVLE